MLLEFLSFPTGNYIGCGTLVRVVERVLEQVFVVDDGRRTTDSGAVDGRRKQSVRKGGTSMITVTTI